jgi:hypothetical protein
MPAADRLVELLRVLQPSLAMYVAESGIWSYPGPEEIRLAVADLVGDQRNVMDRAALILEEREVAVPKNAYPISFSGWHDVDLRHVLPRIVAGLERQQPELERIAATPDDAAAAGLAAEALKSTRQHIEVFKTIAAKLQAGLSAKPAATCDEH